jgi:hypothetical protein
MTWINHYLAAAYEDGSRGPDKYDCWGLAREVLHKYYGWDLMPSWGSVRHTSPRLMTAAQRNTTNKLTPCKPAAGVLACVFRGVLMVHVAVIIEIDGALAALEINPKQGARWSRIPVFERQYLKVVYYDQRLPE